MIFKVWSAARARDTNGADRAGASPATARPVPVFARKRRLEIRSRFLPVDICSTPVLFVARTGSSGLPEAGF
jgi:hypothetical protein